MSWGERSCNKNRPCGYECTMITCNVDCAGYESNGRKPDSGSIRKAIQKLKEAKND